MNRTLLRLSIPFKEPFSTSTGVVVARDLVLLRIEDSDGTVGYGEAAPFEPYDGIPLERAVATLTRRSRGRRPPQVRAAEELARLDVDARREDRPVAEAETEAIPVNRTLSAGPPEEAAAHAAEGMREGYACFKLKVGLPDDEERVAAVRDAIGSWPALRIDANGAWEVEEAIAAIRRLERFDLQFVEQPCATLEEMAEVRRRVSAPIAADESVATAADVLHAAELEACDVVNVKLAASGGFSAAREAVQAAQEHNMAPFLSSTLDGPWAIAAALQLAGSEQLPLTCGLATLELFDAEIARAIPGPRNGLLPVPHGPGFGVDVSDDALAEVLVEEIEQ
jgi:L-Ala-D/L-Glu epimerase / N-acetyl-D-glutamate racemase